MMNRQAEEEPHEGAPGYGQGEGREEQKGEIVVGRSNIMPLRGGDRVCISSSSSTYGRDRVVQACMIWCKDCTGMALMLMLWV